MKKGLYLILLVFFLSSCTNNNNEEVNIDDKIESDVSVNKKQIEDILTQMKSLGNSQGKIIVFELENIIKEDYKKYFKIIQNSKKVLDFASGSDSSLMQKKDNYTVTCNWGNGESEVTECGESVACAGSATWDCLENGGCATICNGKITFVPANIKKLKVDKKNSLELVLKKVKEIGDSKNIPISFTVAYDIEKYWLKEVVINDIELNNTQNKAEPGDFQVNCFNSNGDVMWTLYYYDTTSASQGILDCTDKDGGCAEICEFVAKYFPEKK